MAKRKTASGLILPEGFAENQKTISEMLKEVEPAKKDEAFIRIETRKTERWEGSTPEVNGAEDERKGPEVEEEGATLPQLFVPSGNVANTAKPAHELTNEGGHRPYELLTAEDTKQSFEEAKKTMGLSMVSEDGYKVQIRAPQAAVLASEEQHRKALEQRSAKAVRRDTGIVFKYDEDKILYDLIDYIGTTYSGHYAKAGGLQGLDVWDALGSSVETCRDTAIKYLMRFGQKQGRNHKDLQKAIHYITLMMYFDKKRDET